MTPAPPKTIFIDGEAGTTGLQIRDRLAAIPGLVVKSIAAQHRKDLAHRKAMMADVDLVVLCLPDEAARQAVALVTELGDEAPRVLDASTAHRTTQGWVYGFPELTPGQADAIGTAKRVSNPGCYSTGAIALIRPLMEAGWLKPDTALSINAVSGYSGGGKAMIADFDAGKAPAFHLYGLNLQHKHLPEIIAHTGLTQAPIFVPSVGNFAQGMLVSIPIQLTTLENAPTLSDLEQLFKAYYAEAGPHVIVHEDTPAKLAADSFAGDDRLHIYVFGNESEKQSVLVAQLDNLGKGAAGAAVQNIKLMLNV